jgi:N6-L-threonylcarbamoyladenine synthase
VTIAFPRAAGEAGPHGLVLCIETSCDDTSAALVRGRDVLSSIVSSQNELHAQFGGVVPEVASRRHTELVNAVVAEAMAAAGAGWQDLGAVAATVGPGLIGALLVGLATAKTIAYRRGLPLIAVNHLQGHAAAAYAAGAEAPFVSLVASGGHTLLGVVDEGVRFRLVGRTLDDAAGDAAAVRFPRALPKGPDFSYSGLKTALLYHLRERDEADIAAHRADIAASYQAAIVKQLVAKTLACAQAEGLRRVAVAGGVAANSGLRRAFAAACADHGLALHLPPLALCTDNAAMIGLAAGFLPATPWPEYLALDAYASGLPPA